MRGSTRRLIALAAIAAGTAACSGTGLPSPGTELNTGNALIDLNESIVTLREDDANIQAQVDSLREVVARQDTLLRQFAQQLGVPLPSR